MHFSGGFIFDPAARVLAWAPPVALVASLLIRPWWRAAFFLTAIVAAHVGLTAFSGGDYGYYWGAILQPLALALAPAMVRPLAPASEAAREG